jgi:hypothetical protein
MGTEYYLFRPIGNNQYQEITFKIVKGKIIEPTLHKLSHGERNYILSNII